jgi:hypothetical protein
MHNSIDLWSEMILERKREKGRENRTSVAVMMDNHYGTYALCISYVLWVVLYQNGPVSCVVPTDSCLSGLRQRERVGLPLVH